jgi:CDP-diglyceride synthetase
MDVHFIVALFHIFIVVPFLGYIFINRAATPEYIYNILLFVGLFVLVYHTYKSLLKYTANSQTLYINLIHVFLFAPLLIYIGYNAKKTPRSAYEMLGLITFSALGYHIYNMIVLTQIVDVDD